MLSYNIGICYRWKVGLQIATHFAINVVLQKGESKSLLSCKFSEKDESLYKV